MRIDNRTLPKVPEKLYFSISEVAKLCDVLPSVLRYWEQEFSELRPIKGVGRRRRYQLKDVLIARKIRDLLYTKRFTIEGAKQQLRLDKSSKQIDFPSDNSIAHVNRTFSREIIDEIINELKDLLKNLKN